MLEEPRSLGAAGCHGACQQVTTHQSKRPSTPGDLSNFRMWTKVLTAEDEDMGALCPAPPPSAFKEANHRE